MIFKLSSFFLISFFLLSLTGNIEGSIIINEGFESEPAEWIFATDGYFNDGIDDYSTRTDGITEASGIPSYTGFAGTYFWAAEDTQTTENLDSPYARLIWSDIDYTGVTSLQFSILMGAGSTEAFDPTDDYLSIQYRIDDTLWVDALRFESDGSGINGGLALDADFDGIGESSLLSLNLEEFNTSISTASGSSLDVRIEMIFSSGNEAIAMDNFKVTAIPESQFSHLLIGFFALLSCFHKQILFRSRME